MPTSKVMEVPMSTYQGHAIVANGASVAASEGKAAAIGLAKTMNAIVAIATDMPRIASRWIARRQKIPRKKPPSSPPYVNDAMPSATTTTGVFVSCGKSSAPQREHDAPDEREQPAHLQRVGVVRRSCR